MLFDVVLNLFKRPEVSSTIVEYYVNGAGGGQNWEREKAEKDLITVCFLFFLSCLQQESD